MKTIKPAKPEGGRPPHSNYIGQQVRCRDCGYEGVLEEGDPIVLWWASASEKWGVQFECPCGAAPCDFPHQPAVDVEATKPQPETRQDL